ncbi:Protein phosphatase methylesterase 1 [Pseudozyma hubeiensis]|nr:Protein phosphatase methylesterase 1 [Pseudozyma hubeiensis]
MSDLQRSVVKSRLSKLPPVPSFSEADEEGEEHDIVAPAAIPRLSKRQPRTDDFSPRTAEGFFEQALEVSVPLASGSGSFRVYFTPPRPKAATPSKAASTRAPASLDLDVNVDSPSLPTLKPGMGLPIDDSDLDHQQIPGPSRQSASSSPGTLFVFHHGAGFSALSYALTAAEITRTSGGEVGVLAYDCRGHGRTRLHDIDSNPLDMSIDALSSDLTSLLSTMFPRTEEMPSLVLVGHSMGGSVVVSTAHALSAKGFSRISGVAVLDVVEGTAMDALGVMRNVVLGHPSGFNSVESAIRWHVDSKTIANLESARISVPPLIAPNPAFTPSSTVESLEQDEQQEILDDASSDTSQPDPKPYAYRWRADLLATEPYWPSWFRGLSSRFLSVKTARLLLLAGTDRLDRELMIGQMQGKYQLEVIADVGHSLHEDAPDRTAKILMDFWRRNERVHLPLKHIKKVGEA